MTLLAYNSQKWLQFYQKCKTWGGSEWDAGDKDQEKAAMWLKEGRKGLNGRVKISVDSVQNCARDISQGESEDK